MKEKVFNVFLSLIVAICFGAMVSCDDDDATESTVVIPGPNVNGGSDDGDNGDSPDEGPGPVVYDSINGYAYVDLGLSVKWATVNVGATAPEEYGDYFGWGEIEPKDEYTEGNYTGASINFDISGNPEFDAVTANWGDPWRLPTSDEFKELIENCSVAWSKVNGTMCAVLTSNLNDNTITFSCAGHTNGNIGSYVYYWTSTPSESNAYCWVSANGDDYGVGPWGRWPGKPERGVTE